MAEFDQLKRELAEAKSIADAWESDAKTKAAQAERACASLMEARAIIERVKALIAQAEKQGGG